MSLRVYMYFCPDCDEPNAISVEFDERDLPQECPICGYLECERTWQGMTVAVSTDKTSATIPDIVAKGRFDQARRQQELRKAKSAARQSGDRQGEKQVDKEFARLRKK